MSLQEPEQDPKPPCKNPNCFFCIMKEPNPSLRRSRTARFFDEMPLRDDEEHVLVLSALRKIAMAQPHDPEFPSLGVFVCMGKFIRRGVNDKEWLLKGQNIYIPYYAAHIIGSYTKNKAEFAELVIQSGVVLPLLELLRGKLTWVEQRVAIRALAHLASHDETFEAIAEHEVEVIELAVEMACNCFKVIYKRFVSVRGTKRLKYHCNLLTRGVGGLEMENENAKEWGFQLQSLSLFVLFCFVNKERSLNLIVKNRDFLKSLCGMINGLELMRTLCSYKSGRESVADLNKVVQSICNISRSSSERQYMAIDCLLLLLKDPNTRYKVIDFVAFCLVDLVELRSSSSSCLKQGKRLGETITQVLLQDYHKIRYGGLNLKTRDAEKALKETWYLKVDRIKKEKLTLDKQQLKERKKQVGLLKREGNSKFWCGEVKEATKLYTKALDLCPSKMRKERVVLYSNRAQCRLLLGEFDATISDTTRALCLSSAKSPHCKSLWRRAQAYDMKGLAFESLMDCLMYVDALLNKSNKPKDFKVPYHAAGLISKQVEATCPFRNYSNPKFEVKTRKSNPIECSEDVTELVRRIKEKKGIQSNNYVEESLNGTQSGRSKRAKASRRDTNLLTIQSAHEKI